MINKKLKIQREKIQSKGSISIGRLDVDGYAGDSTNFVFQSYTGNNGDCGFRFSVSNFSLGFPMDGGHW